MALLPVDDPGFDGFGAQLNTEIVAVAGEALAALVPFFIDPADGLAKNSNGGAAGTALCHGITPQAQAIGQVFTGLDPGTVFTLDRGNTLTPGDPVFLGATDGRYDDTATLSDTTGIGLVVSTSDVKFMQPKLVAG